MLTWIFDSDPSQDVAVEEAAEEEAEEGDEEEEDEMEMAAEVVLVVISHLTRIEPGKMKLRTSRTNPNSLHWLEPNEAPELIIHRFND